MTEDQIYDLFPDQIDRSYACPYVPASIAIQIVDLFEANRILILGLEGYEVQNGEYDPRIDLIGDWTQKNDEFTEDFFRKCAQASRDFIRDCLAEDVELMIAFTVEEDW